MNFDEAFAQVLRHEGGFADHPADPGGETMWGVTLRTARAHGYRGDMRDFPRDDAMVIYRDSYWSPCRCEEMPETIRFHLFDAAVNSGPKQATKWLQRALDVADDGIIGPITIAAAALQDPILTICRMTGLRLDLMTSLPMWGQFGRGWARRVAANLRDTA